MKRKFLAALLALVMVFSMIPVSASAAEGEVKVTGDGAFEESGCNVEFFLYTTQLYKMLLIEDSDIDISKVSIGDVYLLLTEKHSIQGNRIFLSRIGLTDAETDYRYLTILNSNHTIEPKNIHGLEINYTENNNSKTIVVPPINIRLDSEIGNANLTADYTIMSSNEDKSIVAFYDNGGNAQGVNYSLYDAYLIPRNTTMQSHGIWPETPSYIAYHFVNWDLNKAGGSPFLQTSVVDGDKEVFSQKSALGDETIGTEIHVINTQNELKARFVELHNAANDSDVTVDDINWDTIKVSVADTDGNETNPNYNTGALPNEWREYQEEIYYWVQNIDADISGLEGTNHYNEHVAFDKITSMTVSADVNGQTYTYTIYKGSDKGDFAVSQLAGNAHIIEIHILAKPEKPDSDDLIGTAEVPGILANGTVAIDCTTNNDHSTETYGLKEGTYTVSDVKWSGSSSDGHYYADVTIVDFEPYVMEYGDGHTPAENQGNDTTITVIYDNTAGAWTVPTNEIPVAYNVACTTEPGGGDEDEPEAPTSDVFKDLISVLCVDNIHESKKYGLLDNGFKFPDEGVVKTGDTYSYTVTIYPDVYADTYSDEIGIAHSLISDRGLSITATYDMDKGQWNTPSPITINVKCDSSTTDPEAPGITVEDVTTALGDNAIAVKCIDNKHETEYFALDGTTVSLGEVTGNEDTGYKCDVTVTLGIGNLSSYLASYNGLTIPQKHGLMSTETITRVLTMKNDANDGKGWYFAGETPIATIDVTCASGETTIPAPDDETVNNLLGKAVIIDCTNDEANHENEAFSLIEDTYQIGEVYMADGIPHCDVTITAPDKYAAQYSYNTNTNHPLAPADQGSQAITLKYVNGEWAIDDDGMVFYKVACEDTSTEPTPDPDPTPDPTPTPGPGGGDNPPYIPPVDPDDSGVSDLLNTDDHIQYLFGYPEGTFGPENNMTRAEVAQMFYNLLLDQDVTITKTFDDVPAGAWYAKAVNTLASLGVVSGVGNGDFEPERSITRAEFTSIAMKFAEGKTGGTNIFSDVKSTDWFYRAVVNSTQYGWIHGYGDGTFRPNNPITRVEVTAIVNNMLGREADVDFVTEHYDELNHFSDLAVSHWGYYHIVEATNDHDYTKPSSGENWTELN